MTNTTYDIDTLSVSDEAKEVLRRTLRVASSSNPAMKESVRNLFVVCPHGACLSDYAKTYERIIIENNVYRIVGKGTYLELAFPKMGTDKDYLGFFNSAKLIAATINSFSGVFLISFEQFGSYNELFKEPAFTNLLKYIDSNSKNISFVFHVLPEFSDYEKLKSTFQAHVNLMEVTLSKPDILDATDYVANELGKTNIIFTKDAKKKLETLVSKKIDLSSKAYLGYTTLDRFANNVAFEVACICDEDQLGMRKVDCKIIDELVDTIEFSMDEKEGSRKLGFM